MLLQNRARALSGMPPVGSFSNDVSLWGPYVTPTYNSDGTLASGSKSLTCGYYGCAGAQLPSYYSAGLQTAKSQGYSVPVNSAPALNGAVVEVVNPDGTVTKIFNWAQYPPTVGGNATDSSFIPPPASVWNGYLVQLGVQTIAQQQAAAVAAAQAYAQQAAQTAAPGVNPADYNPANCLDCGLSPGGTGGSGAGSSSAASAVTSLLTGNVSLAGYSIPVWGLAAAGLALVFLMGGRR